MTPVYYLHNIIKHSSNTRVNIWIRSVTVAKMVAGGGLDRWCSILWLWGLFGYNFTCPLRRDERASTSLGCRVF